MQKKGQKKEILEAELLKNSGKAWIFTGADPCTWKHRSEREEDGLLELADSLGVEFLTYSAESLQENFGSQQFFGICKRSDRGRQCL